VPVRRPTSARERRTIALGVLVSAAALVVAYAVVPFARRWREREEVIATQTERLARLRGLVASEERLREAVRERTAALEAGPRRVLSGRTPALAASALQSAIQAYADESQVLVSRLDVAGAPIEGDPLPRLPATASAVGDVYGIVELLGRLQHGPLALEITELTVRPNPALRGDLIQVTIALQGAYLGE
jgi:hypothetical protein